MSSCRREGERTTTERLRSFSRGIPGSRTASSGAETSDDTSTSGSSSRAVLVQSILSAIQRSACFEVAREDPYVQGVAELLRKDGHGRELDKYSGANDG